VFAQNPLHSVHCFHWLDADMCQWVVAEAELQARRNAINNERQEAKQKNGEAAVAGTYEAERTNNQNDAQPSSCSKTSKGWNRTLLLSIDERGAGCSVYDLNVTWVPKVRDWLVPKLRDVVLPTLAAHFGISPASRLRVSEVNLIKYVALPAGAASGGGTNTDSPSPEEVTSSLKLHRDGYAFSFNVLLNSPQMFEGGGTVFPSLRPNCSSGVDGILSDSRSTNNTISSGPGGQDLLSAGASGDGASACVCLERAGDMLMHSGKILHGAGRISAGVRYILVGFVGVAGLRNSERLENIDWDRTGQDLDLRVLREHWGTMCDEGNSDNESSENGSSSNGSDNDD
jgi:hypothetical protein